MCIYGMKNFIMSLLLQQFIDKKKLYWINHYFDGQKQIVIDLILRLNDWFVFKEKENSFIAFEIKR